MLHVGLADSTANHSKLAEEATVDWMISLVCTRWSPNKASWFTIDITGVDGDKIAIACHS